jgi:hypothetical protein
VTGLWVDHSYDIGMPVDATSVSFFFSIILFLIKAPKIKAVCLRFSCYFFFSPVILMINFLYNRLCIDRLEI